MDEFQIFDRALTAAEVAALTSSADAQGIWAPYYTLHKIMRGLIDAWLLTGNEQALEIVAGMGDWVHSRRIYDQSGDAEYYTAARNFWNMVVPQCMYAHGGTSGTWPASQGDSGNTNPELLQPRGNIANSIGANGAESCTTYNLLKLTKNLFCHEPDAAYIAVAAPAWRTTPSTRNRCSSAPPTTPRCGSTSTSPRRCTGRSGAS